MKQTFAIGIGGAAGQGVATPGDIFAKIFSRRGLHLNAYNAYQSIIRGGHTFLTIRTGPEKVTNMGDHIDLLIPLNQDTMDRHLGLLTAGAACIYNADTIKPGVAAEGAQLCPLPVSKLADITRNKVAQNTLAIGAGLSMMGIGFQALEEVLAEQFKKKGEAVVSENIGIARAGYDYATANFKPFAWPLPMTGSRYAVLSGNAAMAMGGAAAGVKFYCAYPMSPSTGVLHWMAAHARKAGIMVRQVEDEIGVVNMAIGAAHAGVRVHVRHLRRRLCADERGPRPFRHDGNPGRSDRLPAGWPIHRRSHQDRAGRSLADAGRCFRRLSASASPHRSTLEIASKSSRRFSTSPTASSVRESCSAICCCRKAGSASIRKDLDFAPVIDRGELITIASSTPGAMATESTNDTRSPRAVFLRAPFPAFPATPTPSPATSTMKTAS